MPRVLQEIQARTTRGLWLRPNVVAGLASIIILYSLNHILGKNYPLRRHASRTVAISTDYSVTAFAKAVTDYCVYGQINLYCMGSPVHIPGGGGHLESCPMLHPSRADRWCVFCGVLPPTTCLWSNNEIFFRGGNAVPVQCCSARKAMTFRAQPWATPRFTTGRVM